MTNLRTRRDYAEQRVRRKERRGLARTAGPLGCRRAIGDEQIAAVLGPDTCSVAVVVMRWTLRGFYGSFRIGGARLVGRALKMPPSGDMRNPGMGLGTPSALSGEIWS